MSHLSDYFKYEESQLSEAAKQAGIIGHNPTTGKNREDILADFLRKHTPARLLLHSNARIYSLNDDESKEIDLLLINDISINFLNKHHMFTNIESVAAAITVKSYLDKAALYDCLENLASIPQMSKEILSFQFPLAQKRGLFIEHFPSLFIFAYNGIGCKTLANHYSEFYTEHTEIPYNRRPQAIIVNGLYVLERALEDRETFDGQHISKGHIALGIVSDTLRGYPLAIMVREMADYVGWLPYMILNFNLYINKHFSG
jgi:hypothetical protein